MSNSTGIIDNEGGLAHDSEGGPLGSHSSSGREPSVDASFDDEEEDNQSTISERESYVDALLGQLRREEEVGTQEDGGVSEDGTEVSTGDRAGEGQMANLIALLAQMTTDHEVKRYAELTKRVNKKKAAVEGGGGAAISKDDDDGLDGDGERFIVNENDVLGTGGFGVVYKGFDTVRGSYCAVKAALVGPDRATSIKLEFDVFTRLTHPNVVRVLHFDITSDNVARLFMEWVPGGSIASIQSNGVASVGNRATHRPQGVRGINKRRLHEVTLRRYAYDALCGLRYLHQAHVVHRDIKPANMLVSAKGVVKLADLGVASLVLDASTSATGQLAGTLPYMAPECIRSGHYSTASDIWAWACSVVEMATGLPPWSHLSDQVRQRVPLLFHIGIATPPNHHPLIPTHLSSTLQTILQACFSFDPKDRPTAAQLIVECPYFSMTSDLKVFFAQMEPIRGFHRISIRTAAVPEDPSDTKDHHITPDIIDEERGENDGDSQTDPFSAHQDSLNDATYVVMNIEDNDVYDSEADVTEVLGGPMSSQLLLLSE